jgi:hypothetical protein
LRFFSGRLRTGLPVAAWIAFMTDGATTQIVGFRRPRNRATARSRCRHQHVVRLAVDVESAHEVLLRKPYFDPHFFSGTLFSGKRFARPAMLLTRRKRVVEPEDNMPTRPVGAPANVLSQWGTALPLEVSDADLTVTAEPPAPNISMPT